eukprot:CAMPEP_0117525816 /NCGR_PEP_ID=MMETSP0784-20121206/35967_1 /TAXON_ID=39447 /ORGANISM="" /LENGTH=232 /DNA_ID=CAMNT_0005322029 /DNA_START=35 /DNA_END=733 /DNA_ORIENTATION=+
MPRRAAWIRCGPLGVWVGAALAAVIGSVASAPPRRLSTSLECRAGLDAMLRDPNWEFHNNSFTRWCRVLLENEFSQCCSMADFARGRAEDCTDCEAKCIHQPLAQFCTAYFGKACVVKRKPFFPGAKDLVVLETFCVPEDCNNAADRAALMPWYSLTYKPRRSGWHKDYDQALLECPDSLVEGLVWTFFVLVLIVVLGIVAYFLLVAPKDKGVTLVSQEQMQREAESDEEED